MIPPFAHGRISIHDPVPTWAVFVMVIDDPARLQMGINRDRSDILEAALLQVFADLVRQAVADRDRPDVMPLIQNRLSFGITPDVITEAAKLLAHFPVTPGIVDYRPHLARRPDHSFRIQDTFHIRIVIFGNPVKSLRKESKMVQTKKQYCAFR